MQTSPAPAIVAGGAYQPVVLHAGLAYVRAQLPRPHGEPPRTGKLGSELAPATATHTPRPWPAAPPPAPGAPPRR
ncbi:hypothetical protein ACLI38_34965, partial [Pseudomonas aeruginosa]